MADDTVVLIDVQVEDNSSTDITNITNNVVHLHQAVQREEKQERSWQASLKRVAAVSLSVARAVARVAASIAAVAAATGPAISGVLAAGKAFAVLGQSLASLAALAAFLPSLAAAFVLVTKTATLMGPGFAKAFEPISRVFVDAEGEASAFTKRLQAIAGIGIRPLAQEFVKLNIPAITRGMEGVAYQLNGIVFHVLRLLNTQKGIQAIRAVAWGTAHAFERISPHVIAFADALIGLTGRAGARGLNAIADAINKVLDKLTAWANNTSVEDIKKAMSDFAGYGGRLKDTFNVLRDVGRWMAENKDKVKAFSDVVAAAAITLGVATGNIPAILAGAFALIVNHWDEVKALFKGATPIVKDLFERWKNDAGRIAIAEGIMNALRNLRQGFESATKDIGPKWARFIHQVKGAWQEWAPLIAAWWNTVGSVIFNLIGKAIGIGLTNLLDFAAGVAATTRLVGEAFRAIIPVVLNFISTVLNGAAKAFGWVPGIGPKLQEAAREFNKFADEVNRALNRIDPVKTVRINASVYVTGNNNAAGGVDQRTGNSRNAGLSGLTSWQQAAAAFAAAGGLALAGDRGTSRVGGPTPVHSEVSVNVSLDGVPFRAMTSKVVSASEERQAWRAKVGRRR